MECQALIIRLFDMDVPMIAAINGPAKHHSELALLCDIVLACEGATLEDTAHFHLGGHVPGDGVRACSDHHWNGASARSIPTMAPTGAVRPSSSSAWRAGPSL